MRLIRPLGFIICFFLLGIPRYRAGADEPRPSLRLEEPSTMVLVGPDPLPSVVIFPVRTIGVQDLTFKLIDVHEGRSGVLTTVKLSHGKGDRPDSGTGHLVLLLAPKDKGKLLLPSLGFEFGKAGFTASLNRTPCS